MLSKHSVIASIGICGLFLVAGYVQKEPDPRLSLPIIEPSRDIHWPEYREHPRAALVAAVGLKEPRSREFGRVELPYDPAGKYLMISRKKYPPTKTLIFDDAGVPMVKSKTSGDFVYNPVTIGHFALARYTTYLATGESKDVLIGADKLIDMQEDDGSFRYNYEWKHRSQEIPFAPGWVSAMAQGGAMSAFARAYLITEDPKYLAAGEKAFEFLQLPVEDGGVMDTMADLDPSLSEFIYFQEYVTKPANYTLNGYMFAMFGLYDWWKITGNQKAGGLFNKSVETLARVLPYYDLKVHSAYDLGHITYPTHPRFPQIARPYHGIHIDQLMSLYSVTGNEKLKEWADRWSSY